MCLEMVQKAPNQTKYFQQGPSGKHLKNILIGQLKRITPQPVLEHYRYRRFRRGVKALRRLSGPHPDLERCFDQIWPFPYLRPIQKKSEIAGLCATIQKLQPSVICEIGASGGGSLFLFSQAAPPNAILLSIDIAFSWPKRKAFPGLGKCSQKIFCLKADSQIPETVEKARALLEDRPIDLLFIDGDHRYDGVKMDLELFSPLVRQGGLVGFHDIVPDHTMRYGTDTSVDSGGVPIFWEEIEARFPDTQELIENSELDGFGIGILIWPGIITAS